MIRQFPDDGSHFDETTFSKCGFLFTSIEDDNLMTAISFWMEAVCQTVVGVLGNVFDRIVCSLLR